MPNPGQFSFTPEEYRQAAIQYRRDLLMLPIIGIQSSLQFMTVRPGIRYKESVGSLTGDAQFAPYKRDRVSQFDLKLANRELETFFGSVVADFEPNSAISTLLGTGATKGDGQMQTPTAMHVLAIIAKSLSEHLNEALWKAKRDHDGDTTLTLFDGFDTITQNEITAGNISEANNNLLDLSTEAVTAANAVDIAKEIMKSLHPILRGKECYFYCSQDFLDCYNEGYMLSHGGIQYNTQYGQQSVEGSGGLLKFVPLPNKADSGFIHVSPKSNMLVGMDQMGDLESVAVKEYKPFVLTYIATMFFGTQFESIDPRVFKAVKINTAGA